MYPRLSPDGTRVALDVRDQDQDIWIWDLAREALTRFTFDAAQDGYPVWTPDGRRLVFASDRTGQLNLFWQAADGTGTVDRLTESPNQQRPSAFSPDGTRLVFREDRPTANAVTNGQVGSVQGRDLALLAVAGQQPVEPLVHTRFLEANGEISPDGRWLAYQSNESGQDEIYVRPFPEIDRGRWPISTGGGSRPLWAPHGKELFYLGPSGAVMSVPVQGGSTFTAGNPTKLFEGYFLGGGASGRTYDVSPDGQRFLMIKELGGSAVAPTIVVIQNWTEELKAKVPTP